MRFRLFTLRYSPTLGGFDDRPLQDFVRDKEVSAFREHFFVVEDMPHLCCVVTWLDQVVGTHPQPDAAPKAKPRGGKPDPTEGLDPVQRALFQRMREWRTETARDEGVPPYVVLTNRELVALVQERPDSTTALTAIDGIGKQRVERFGKRILQALHGAPVDEVAAAPQEATP